ncbi:unnamed protein product [Caenorhabditis angaria]|uniref:Nuclear receptor domain-containing protein n=1 Tax=Caenorhabditis angaria TaxID=860376 RepID=A0A9P1ITY8_9PELO|nr:unnamed protein product [Caenorhabditis angaria]
MDRHEQSCSDLPDIPKVPLKKYRSLAKNQCPALCLVCRNPAVGYHYDVASCNGCKTFFRRTIILGKQYSCPKSNDCLNPSIILDPSKRICRRCRFDKCVESGMNPLAIQAEVKSEKGKEMQVEIAKNNRVGPSLQNMEDRINGIIEELMRIETNVEALNNSGLPIGFRDMRSLRQIILIPPCFDIRDHLRNLIYIQPRCDPITGIPLKPMWSTFTHTSYLASIEYSKSFDFYFSMDDESKEVLVKHSTLIISNIFNAFYTMNTQKSDELLHPDGSLAGPALKNDKGVQILNTIQRTLIALLRNKLDRIEYVLLKAIIICNPAIPGLSKHSQILIEKCRMQYTQSLFIYCRLQHGNLNGPARFSALIATTSVFENQQKDQKDFYIYMKAMNYRRYQPFLEDPQSWVHDEKGTKIFDEIMEG